MDAPLNPATTGIGAANVESLDRGGRGVAHVEGKTLFIDGALPGEVVEYALYRGKRNYEFAQTLKVVRSSASRVEPRCAHFGVCGGCSLQHLDETAQVAVKQRVLEDALWHIGRVRAETVLAPVHGLHWRYRNRARLSARMVPRKGGVLVGFRERKSSYVAEMDSCEVLPEAVSALIPRLRQLIAELSISDRLPQVEVVIGDEVTVLVLRILSSLAAADESRLREFAETAGVHLWLQSKGPDSVVPFWPEVMPPLYYSLPEFGVRIAFSPTDFTQVNSVVNRILVRRALAMLDPQPGERVGDYFCGLGNFTLPIASTGAHVTGYEGSANMVARARENAESNGLARQCSFVVADLFDRKTCERLGPLDKVLIDPPREGAIEAVKAFSRTGPRRIVYVSCDPATLARDAGLMVNAQGYALRAAGIVNMFAHTSHVESLALFERE